MTLGSWRTYRGYRYRVTLHLNALWTLRYRARIDGAREYCATRSSWGAARAAEYQIDRLIERTAPYTQPAVS